MKSFLIKLFLKYIVVIYIYIDESGDLGFSEKSCNYFVISAVRIEDEKTKMKFESIIDRIKKKKLKKKEKMNSEMKFSNSKRTREIILKEILELNIEIFSVILFKNMIKEKTPKEIIYLNLVLKLLTVLNIENEKSIIYIDKSFTYEKSKWFNYKIFEKYKYCAVYHENSYENKGLMAIDFIVGSFGYKYNSKNCTYYDLIKLKIKSELRYP